MNRGVFEGSFEGCSAANSAQSSWVSRRSGRPEDRVPAGATVSQNQCSRWRRSSILARKVQSSMKIIPASDSSLLVVFGNAISLALHERVIALFHAFQARHDPRIRNLHPGYASLLIDFDPLQLTHDELTATVQQLADTGDVTAGRKRATWSPFQCATTLSSDLTWPMLRGTRAFRLKRLFEYILRQRTMCISSDSLRVSCTSEGCRKSCTLPGWPHPGRQSRAAASGLQAVKPASIRWTLPEDGS